ncbi:pyrimidine dimer DNA glycosylase/endonuclease V [Kurthia senegalensis]|uniref:pyrimidine dimer DNA glycosylase/endonuclease V n=1 Tax=Kurthia senegalensis TaxID=1033740 RepID=UPI00028978A0|nr:pyrimidine dimer DNA glycosylase/endonuclease V [Kurthia senegalensis]
MRLWHYEIIPFLPKGQLLSQWRELNSIFAKEDRHVLINYVYEYDRTDLRAYTKLIMDEMGKRGYRIRSFDKMNNYFSGVADVPVAHPFVNHHNDEYLEICFYNLKEKFIRGQKDYERLDYDRLVAYVLPKLEKKNK